MKRIIYIIVVFIAVTAAFFTLQPVQEISFLSPEAETVISWNFDGVTASQDIFDISSIEKYFSIEKFINEDINDIFYISIEKYTYDGVKIYIDDFIEYNDGALSVCCIVTAADNREVYAIIPAAEFITEYIRMGTKVIYPASA